VSLVGSTATAITTVLYAIPDIGKVYDYDPFPRGEWQEFVQLFTADVGGQTVVRAWTVKHVARRTVPHSIAQNAEVQRVEMDWLVRGFLGLNDPTSDGQFRELLELVTERLNQNRRLVGAQEIIDHDPADYILPNSGALLALGDTICHYGEVTFTSYHDHVIAVS
jgi:hypothetical protein